MHVVEFSIKCTYSMAYVCNTVCIHIHTSDFELIVLCAGLAGMRTLSTHTNMYITIVNNIYVTGLQACAQPPTHTSPPTHTHTSPTHTHMHTSPTHTHIHTCTTTHTQYLQQQSLLRVSHKKRYGILQVQCQQVQVSHTAYTCTCTSTIIFLVRQVTPINVIYIRTYM